MFPGGEPGSAELLERIFAPPPLRPSASACPVCCDDYTAKVRTPVSCPACGYGPCTRCVKTYLLSSLTDPSCMNCGLHWNRAFIDSKLTCAWREGELRRHRRRVLFDRERSMLPATQPAVEHAVVLQGLEKARRDAFGAVGEARAALATAKEAHYAAMRALHSHEQTGSSGLDVERERRAFVAACPTEACRGFLSSQYKCGTCLRLFCPSCREAKTEGHVCDPGVVATLKAIAAESKACPGCGMAISRVSGCDQMYCTQCDVPFSYATGQKIAGVIHNPHYFERLRQLRAGEETGGDAPAAREHLHADLDCGRWPSMSSFHWLDPEATMMLTSFYRTGTNIEHTRLPGMQQRALRREDNLDLRIRYCLRSIDEEQFMSLLEQRERRREFELDVRGCLELFVLLSMEACLRVRALGGSPGREEKAHAVLCAHGEQVEELVNKPLRELSRRYKQGVPLIDLPEVWRANYRDLCVQFRYQRPQPASVRTALPPS